MESQNGFLRNFTKEQIESYLDEIKQKVKQEKYTISLNQKREKNINFMNDYQVSSELAKNILLSLQVEDFGYALKNDNPHPKFCNEVLYVFCKTSELTLFGEEEAEEVEIFIKMNNLYHKCVVVSFHRAEKEFNFLFK